MPPFPSFTKTWHTASYAAISPTRPELSTANKVVVITGGGTGIGAGIARAFATSGSKKIALLGRRQEPLTQTAKALETDFPGLEVLPCSTDVTNKSQVDSTFNTIAEKFGPIDILINNAGYLTGGSVSDMDPNDAWTAFEIHAKGSILVAQAFSRTKNQTSSFVVETSSIVVAIPPWPAAAAYTASKLAATKLWEFYSVENPSTRVVSIQPGQVQTDMTKKLGVGMAPDDVNLASNFAVWLVGPEAGFLNGTFACANWDVEELMARKEEYEKTDLGTIKLEGFPSFKAKV